MKRLHPTPDRIVLSGSSAGAFGTFMAYPMVRAAYPDTPVYVLNDSGVGFWNPEDVATWEVIKAAWNLRIPELCERCDETTFTYIYETYLANDPLLRIGMFSSYRDSIITGTFLKMDGDAFKELLVEVTGAIREVEPTRFGRFLVAGSTHTTYDAAPAVLFPKGGDYRIDGTSLFEWIEALITPGEAVPDLLEVEE